MCRLSAITATDIDPVHKALIMQYLMLQSNIDGIQIDGWGIWSKEMVVKSGHSFHVDGRVALQRIDSFNAFPTVRDNILMGHVRSASSPAMDKGRIEGAHPYVYPIKNGQGELITYLTLAHNGTVDFPRNYKDYQSSDPNTDSYRAGKLLHATLERAGTADITVEMVEDWVSMFYASPKPLYVFMLYNQKDLYIVRGGEDRTLYYKHMGNGLVFNTSVNNLDQVAAFASALGYHVSEETWGIAPHTFARVEPGNPKLMDYVTLEPEYQKGYVVPLPAAAGERNPGGKKANGGTVLTVNDLSDGDEVSEDEIEAETLSDLWMSIRMGLTPMRRGILQVWFDQYVALRTEQQPTVDHLKMFWGHVRASLGHAVVYDGSGQIIVPRYPRGLTLPIELRKQIDHWNKIVRTGEEEDVAYLFYSMHFQYPYELVNDFDQFKSMLSTTIEEYFFEDKVNKKEAL